ncbi:hypothetical protein [Streptomyces pseudogriseolus]
MADRRLAGRVPGRLLTPASARARECDAARQSADFTRTVSGMSRVA